MNRQQQIVRLPEPAQMGQLIVQGVTSFARRNKVLTGFYIFGWIFLLFVGAGTQLTLEQRQQYNRIMNSIDLQAEYDASADYWQARQVFHASRGWFWSCNDRYCQRNKALFEEAERTLNDIRAEGAARMSDAKKTAGILSQVGVGEIKDSFWQYLYQGKQFAKRQSMWDALFIGIRQMSRGRDETWIEFGLKVLMNVLINFTMGLFMSLLFFIIGLWSIVTSYQPNPLMAVLVFGGAAAAGFAYVSTYLFAIYGAAAGGVYGLLKVVETSARQNLEGQRGGQPQRVNNYQRPHYD
mmetsp:Transcript_9895/g.13059  ORF Transcript_9895/g.13059 Transcript_9895/m.13059 type:complete len:295 (-) Transcript_9895:77-961(-)